MGDLLVNGSAFFDLNPFDAFHQFGRTEGSGWLMSARFAAPEAGVVAEMDVPVPHGSLNDPTNPAFVRGTGRIIETVPWRRIVLQQESPWSSETTISFAPRDGGTMVRVTANITDDAVGWMNERLGQSLDLASDDAVSIGLVCSLSGEAGLFGRAVLNCALLAAEEVNREGGVLGRPLRIVHVDEATSGPVAIRRLHRLLERQDLAAVVGSHTSATLNAIRPQILARKVLYLYAPVNEGSPREGNLFRFGESSLDQLRYVIPELARRTGGRAWYIIGNDYSWPREIGKIARQAIGAIGGRVVGEEYVPMGHHSYDDFLERIRASGADMLVSGLVGYDSVDFERAFVDAGLRSNIVTLAALLDDSTLDHLGPTADGLWSALSYFGGDAASQGFQERYLAAWGVHSPPPSTISASVYDSVHLWAQAARRAKSTVPDDVGSALTGMTFDGSRGSVTVTPSGNLTTDIFLARAQNRTFVVEDRYRTRGAS